MTLESWFWLGLSIFFIGSFVATLLYARRVRSSKKWPQVTATIQRGAVGGVPLGTAGVDAAFFGYRYEVNSVRYVSISLSRRSELSS